MNHPQRMKTRSSTNGVNGRVVWSPVKSIWFSTMAAIALIFGPATVSWSILLMFIALTVSTLCCGHSVGLHRLLIHRSFKCPLWLEFCLVYTGTMVGMGGPRRMVYMHEIRDWAQRQTASHPFFIHKSRFLIDGFWNLHCECRLENPPLFSPEERVTEPVFYQLLDKYWMAAQLPLAGILYLCGSWAWIVWGICVRITVSLTGHWMVGYFAHNHGEMKWRVNGASVQGYNLKGLGLLTMGEAWHNNHHAFPESAKFGLEAGQNDPGWWLLVILSKCGLVTDLTLPQDIPVRLELERVKETIEGSRETTPLNALKEQSIPNIRHHSLSRGEQAMY